jgi:hypothetical protein
MSARSQSPKEEGPWLWMTHEAFEQASKLGGHAVAVYSALAYFESRASADYKDRFMVSLEDLAKAAGFSRTTVCEAVGKLKNAGLIETVSGTNKKQIKVRNAYRILSVSSSTAGEQRSTAGERPLSTRGERHLSTAGGRLIKNKNSYSAGPQGPAAVTNKEEDKNSYSAGPQGPAAVTNKEEEGDARSPLRGGGAPQKTKEELSTLIKELESGLRFAKMRAFQEELSGSFDRPTEADAMVEEFQARLKAAEEELTHLKKAESDALLTGGGAPQKMISELARMQREHDEGLASSTETEAEARTRIQEMLKNL